MRVKEKPLASRLFQAAFLLAVAAILVLLFRDCERPEKEEQSSAAVGQITAATSRSRLAEGRPVHLSGSHPATDLVLKQLAEKRAKMESCISAARGSSLVYRVRIRWNAEGNWLQTWATPTFAPSLEKCLNLEIAALALPPDPGMRDREFEFELRVR